MTKSLLCLVAICCALPAFASECSPEQSKAAILSLLPQDQSQFFIAEMSYKNSEILAAPYIDNEFTHYLVVHTNAGAAPELLHAKVNGHCQAYLAPGELATTQIK